ncbi:hypothetical protein BsWGS_28731 [Bradybaena similaris]
MPYQHFGTGGQYGSKAKYPMACGAGNPRSPPNVVPMSSLVQMTPGTSLRLYATQGGLGLPPSYPFQQGQLSQNIQQPPALICQHLQQPVVSSPAHSSASMVSQDPGLQISEFHGSTVAPSRTASLVTDIPAYASQGFTGSVAGSTGSSSLVTSAGRTHDGPSGRMLHFPLSPTLSGYHRGSPTSSQGLGTPSLDCRLTQSVHGYYDHRMVGSGVQGQHKNHPEDDRNRLLHMNMFSPPAPVATNAVKNGMPESGGLFAHEYKTEGLSDVIKSKLRQTYLDQQIIGLAEGGPWNSNQPAAFDSRYDDHNGQYNGTGAEHIEHFLGPVAAEDKGGNMYPGLGYRDVLHSQGLLAGTMSPDVVASGKTTCPSYYAYSKRPLEESPRGSRSSEKMSNSKKRNGSTAYSPGPEDFSQDSPRYHSPKPGMYGEYFMDQSSVPGEPWSSSLPSSYPSSHLPGSSGGFSQQSSFPPNMQHHGDLPYLHPVSPREDPHLSSSSGLPPMSSFRGGQPVGGASVPSSGTGYAAGAPSPAVNGSDLLSRPPVSGSSGIAVGKALASIYSTEQTNSSYDGSGPTSPVSSPPPVQGGGVGPPQHWSRPPAHPGAASHYDTAHGHLHPLSRMEERLDLDDAIHVLRTHAEGQPFLPAGHPGLPPSMLPAGHPVNVLGAMGSYAGGMMVGHLDAPHLGNHHGLSNDRVPPPSSLPSLSSDQAKSYDTGDDDGDASCDGPIKMEKNGKLEGDKGDKMAGDKSTKSGSAGEPPSKRTRYDSSSDRSGQKSAANKIANKQQEDDTNLTPADKAEREKVRRQANNNRERVRVRDINEAFKELGQMVTLHCTSSQPLTKLMVLQQAVNVITSLESQVRERNLNPKAACLKRREEEKTEELPGRSLSSDDLPQHAGLATKCPPEPGKGWHAW